MQIVLILPPFMQTSLADFIKDSPSGREAEAILRTCVHCGFCNATCPTYQLLGDELDGPRGRIYLIKQALEGRSVSRKTQVHLDRCLSCRACETTCPSGVHYSRLLDIGREIVEPRAPRPVWERLKRWLLRTIVPYPARFTPLLRLGQTLRPVLPARLKRGIPPRIKKRAWPQTKHQRTMLILEGCIQPALAPTINMATAQVLDKLGISVRAAPGSGCCGALSQHLSASEQAQHFMRCNIDAWWPYITAGAEAIIVTASGCGVLVKDYGHLLREDQTYAEKAAQVSRLTKDVSKVLARENLAVIKESMRPLLTSAWSRDKIAFHSPCTLQHGQKLNDAVETILRSLGFILTAVPDSHVCCGSAGTYSLLQQSLSQRLLKNKLHALQSGSPAMIATANIGCLAHLQTQSAVPVKHWIELLASD